MHAGDGDAVFQPHQLGQHFGPLDDRNLACPGFDDLGIALADRRTRHHHTGADDIPCRVTLEDGCSESAEPIRGSGAAEVGARDGVAEVQQNLGDSAHPDAANSYKMNSLRLDKHGCRCTPATLTADRWEMWFSCGGWQFVRMCGSRNFLLHLYVYKGRLRKSAGPLRSRVTLGGIAR